MTEAGPEGLASRLLDAGALTPDWLAAYRAVPRELFVPDVVWTGVGAGTGRAEAVVRGEDPEAWLRAVYSDGSLTTQWDDGAHTGTLRGKVPTCSNTQPSVVFSMLRALDIPPDVPPEFAALEVGTGTGWNAALLSERLGSSHVVTVEFDGDNAAAARLRLDAAGYQPATVVADGSEGWPARAPYDRVLVTAGVREIPGEIVRQTRAGGIIVCPYGTPYGAEAVVRLTVHEDGSASGPFVMDSAFMRLRQQRENWPHTREYLGGDWPADGRRSETGLSPEEVADWLPRFVLGLQLSGTAPFREPDDDGSYVLWLRDDKVTSWATVDYVPDKDTFLVYQGGPRALWGEVEAAYTWWNGQGRPGLERFGLTLTPDGVPRAWLDSPEQPVPAVGQGLS
ncbi:protein-L-isoaspartate O-methyltransferase family protein [Streptomyces liangshanensis]|uniref:protein-L-isoaspartate O-methyltransferase family protein n=1 Tax=Streptomyces liangshanensis TaxID=2717324 RepID=UPI001FB88418|nr:methyltransferase domain-containing protein [Streptomyces liangshanensis]